MGVFQQTIKNFAPAYFLGRTMGTLLESVGAAYDIHAQRVFDGRRAGNPFAGGSSATRAGASRTDAGILRECDPDALAYHARDRGIRLYTTEPLISQRTRLGMWRQLRKARGSHPGELRNVQPFFLGGPPVATGTDGSLYPTPWMRIVFQSNEATATATWYTLTPDGVLLIHRQNPSNWNWDGQPSKRSRFWAIVHLPPGYQNGFLWDSGPAWNSGPLWDGVLQAALDDIVAGIKEAKAAHSRLSALIFTALQPTDSIPGHPGVHPFDPTSTSTTNSDTSTNLPTGNWGSAVWTSGPNIGLNSRPSWASFYAIDNG